MGDAKALEWIRPLAPAPKPVPRWALVLLGAGTLGAIIEQFSREGLALWFSIPLGAVGFVGLAGLGQTVEQALYARVARRSFWARVGLGLVLPWAVLLATVVATALLNLVGLDGQHGFALWLRQAVGLLGLWVAAGSVGSTVVVLLDTVVSRLVPGFRGRILAAVLTLIGLTTALNVFVLTVATSLLGLAARSTETMNLTIDLPSGPMKGKEAQAMLLEHPVLVGLFVFATFFVLATPAVISACFRLADAVVMRLEPLSRALAKVGQGERALRVEEAGSRDFVEVNTRFNEMVDALERSERMERAFGVYVSGHVLERIRAQHGEAIIPASLREASVFFADIRGFTAASERLAPDQVVAFLNRYFARVVKVVDAHEGYLNKFIGDAVVVVFNGPVDQPDHAARAVRCALALQDEVRRLNAEGAFPEIGELRIGIGVATGPMVCGNVGGSTQMEYTVIGDTVNLSSRLTSHAGPGEVWVSEATARGLPEGVVAQALEPLKVKGKVEPVRPSRVARAALSSTPETV